MNAIRCAVACTIVMASPLALSTSASAAPSEGLPVTFWVDPSSAACADAAAAMTRDLGLACEAAHAGCSISSTKDDANRILVFRCQADAEAEAASISSSDALGERWRINLSGAEADHSRSAALYAVRFETTNALVPLAPSEPVSPYVWRREEPKLAPPAPAEDTTAAKVLTLGGLGIAVVAGAVGGITAAQSMHESARLERACPNQRCPAGASDDLARVNTLAKVSTVSFIAAGAGLITSLVGLVLWKSGGSSPKTRGTSTSVRATAGAGWAGLAGAF